MLSESMASLFVLVVMNVAMLFISSSSSLAIISGWQKKLSGLFTHVT